ncbi:MAG: response regulator [Candidatus Moranbacteria bacterium]|nr:response regulator [Candidatus Moranbacteria bacterium]
MGAKKLKILLVDDDDSTREIYAEVFKNSDFDVLEAKDGVEGLDIATRELPDVIFTGIIMPRMDGFTMMEALKKNLATSNIPVVISSHMGREEDQQKANVLGARDFIVRDVTSPNQVVERINALFLAGGEYRLDFNAYNLDAQKLARELGLNNNFQCLECNEKLVMQLKLQNPKEQLFEARFLCPHCGWVAR